MGNQLQAGRSPSVAMSLRLTQPSRRPQTLAAAWCPGTVGEPFCCGAGQTCGDVLIKGKTEQGCRCSKTEYDDCLGTAGVSNGCKATSSASNP